MVASEVAPWSKTGGLADVIGALSHALAALGHTVTILFPRYRHMDAPGADEMPLRLRLGAIDQDVVLQITQPSPRVRAVMVDAPALFNREGYYGEGGQDYADNPIRFATLAAAALEYARRMAAERPFDVLHGHDWQTGLVPAFARGESPYQTSFTEAGVVFTIHNLAYQGLFPRDVVPLVGLPWSAFTIERGEFYGQFSFLKAGITFSDFITTVSPTYARETQTAAAGAGMEGVLHRRARRYVGILNGIDTDVWNPASDRYLPATYSVDDLEGKRQCKRALLARFGFPVGDDALARPVVGWVSRLVEQKGLDLVLAAGDRLVRQDATWIFVGTGDAHYERALRELAARHPTRVAVHIGFDEPLAHLVEGGSDMFLMPSRFEPCGLGQMYSLRYGTVPIVTAVGGLDDTVQSYTSRAKHANGFKLREPTADSLVRTVRQALRVYRDAAAWRGLVRNGMTADLSWQTAAREYVKVYRRARDVASMRGGL